MAIFEAVHGSVPDIAGKNLANPTAIILSGCMMLDYLGKTTESNYIRRALETVLSDPENFTHDLKGTATTDEFTQEVIRRVQKQLN